MDLDKIKRLTLRALMSDEMLMRSLVLKGGNALQLAYEITNRGSIDIDFSVQREFTEEEFVKMPIIMEYTLNSVFREEKLIAFDVTFDLKPKQQVIPEWKGYILQFKLITMDLFDSFRDDEDGRRRNALVLNDNRSTKYMVDISAHEFVETATKIEIDGVLLRVYTLEMILFEKVRALCQTMSSYKSIVPTASQKQRARDIYDIYTISLTPQLHLDSDILREIFKAKKVPLSFINELHTLREHNRDDWNSVKQTVSPDIDLQDYDYYFDKLLDIIVPFKNLEE